MNQRNLLFLLLLIAQCLRAVAQSSTAPQLVSIQRATAVSLAAGEEVRINYAIQTNGWPVTYVELWFTDPLGGTFKMSDFSASGTARAVPGAIGRIGTYRLAIAFVGNSSGFAATYYRSGSIEKSPSGLAGPTSHSLSFSSVDFTAVTPTVPIIIQQPDPSTNGAGQPFTLMVWVLNEAGVSYQWRKDGVPISGATSKTFSVSSSKTTDSGSYSVVATNSAGSVTSNSVAVSVRAPEPLPVPAISAQPVSARVTAGQSANFALVVSSQTAVALQWRKNGIPITGATGERLSFSSATTSDAGSYDVVVTNSGGSVTSSAATLTVDSGRVKNISVRIVVPDNGLLIAGFVLDTPKAVLVRGIGRSLEQFGVAAGSTMPNPSVEVFNSSGVVIAQNDDFTASAALSATTTRAGAFGLASAQDAALVVTLPAGAYTVQLKPVGGRGGDALVEVYDVD